MRSFSSFLAAAWLAWSAASAGAFSSGLVPVASGGPDLCAHRGLNAEVGLSYYGYRFYNPGLGRWTSRDPLGETADPARNLSRFVGNNPLNAVDPDGQREMSIGLASRSTGSSFYYGPVLRAPDNPARGLAVQNLTLGSNLDPSSPMAEQYAFDFAVNLFTAPGQAMFLGAIGSTIERFLPQTGLTRCPVKSGASNRRYLEYKVLRGQGNTASEAYSLIKQFDSGSNLGGSYAFHFTSEGRAAGILNNNIINISRSGVAGPGVYAGTTPTPGAFLKNSPFVGWGLGGKGANVRVPIPMNQPSFSPWLPPKTVVFPDPVSIR